MYRFFFLSYTTAMNIYVGTTNKAKLDAVTSVATEMRVHPSFEVHGYKAESGVSETPLNEQTILGALNRAKAVRNAYPEEDMYIGIESGIVSRYSDFYEEVWAVVIYGKKVCAAYSSGVRLPDKVVDHINGDIQNHPNAMDTLREEYDIEHHDGNNSDTWGNYTGNIIDREVGVKEAIRNTLVQIFPGDKSFY